MFLPHHEFKYFKIDRFWSVEIVKLLVQALSLDFFINHIPIFMFINHIISFTFSLLNSFMCFRLKEVFRGNFLVFDKKVIESGNAPLKPKFCSLNLNTELKKLDGLDLYTNCSKMF